MKMLLLGALFCSQSLLANENHYHPKKILKCSGECTEVQIRTSVPEALSILVKAKEIRESWIKVKVEKIEKKKFKKAEEWVVSFYDKSVTDATKQRLYMFISLDGWLNGANNSGN